MGTPIKNYSRGVSRLFAGLFLALGLVAALSLSFAQLASASPLQPAGKNLDKTTSDLGPCSPQITITAPEGDHEYGAYQLFNGDLSGGKLTNIKWGSGIDSAGLLTALAKSDIAKLKVVTKDTTAPELAKLLESLTTDSEKMEFAKVAMKHIKKGTAKTFEKTGDKEAGFEYTADLTGEEHGYYLVKDTTDTPAALTAPIVRVLGCAVSVAAKGSAPSSTKQIKEDSPEAWGKTADFEIGEKAPFKLTGTVSSRIGDFTTYKYGFTDFISKGFTLREGFDATDLTVKIGDKEITPDTVNVTDITDDTHGAEYNGGKQIEIMFTDLKATAKAAGVDLTADSVVTVEYSATVNENAVVGGIGNPNKSFVVYEKNVNGGTEGKTPPQEVWAFTYKLDTTKVDADSKKKLTDAEFVLYNKDKSKSAKIDKKGRIVEWVADNGDTPGGTPIASSADELYHITGLDADTYYLKETVAPSGYNLPERDAAFFKFVITSKVSVDKGTSKGKIDALKITVGTNPATDGNTTEGSVAMTIENTSGSTLPGTGGIGTVIFTVVGLLVMAGAAGGFVWRRKQNS